MQGHLHHHCHDSHIVSDVTSWKEEYLEAEYAYRRSSIRNTHMSKELWDKVSAQEATTNENAASVDSQIAVVERNLAKLSTTEGVHDQTAGDGDDEEIGGAETQLREELFALRSSRSLLAELSRLVKRAEVEKLTSKGSDHSTNISFGDNNSGLQTGINHGPINWTSGKRS